MKTFFAFTTGALVGAIGIAIAFLGSSEIREAWNTTADCVSKW